MRSTTFPGFRGSYPYPRRSDPHAGKRTRGFRLNLRRMVQYTFFSVLLTGIIAALGLTVWTAHTLRGLNHDLAALITYKPGEATLIYAADGTLLSRIAKENRIYAPLDRVPEFLRNATIASEDRRFWEHSGVDARGLARAFWRDLREGRAAEGGSTLTMQLVRNIQLTPEKTLERKVREAALALQMERIYEKPRLLEMYLNQVFYGSGAYGVGAAARTYFGKPVMKLTAAQSALLATIPRRPTEYNPYRDPDGSLTRRNRLLKEMAAQGYLTSNQLQKALKEPLGVKPRSYHSKKAPYFVDAVLDRLIELYGSEKVYQGGLRVYTTINPRLQEFAEASLRDGVNSLKGRNVTQGALVSIDPFTQEVKAMVGGVDYRKSAYNRTLAHRQPGSAFKPFVYAAAFDMGLTPLDKITDSPIKFARYNGWRPKNHSGGYSGRTTLRNAFAQSMNIPAVKLALTAGIPQVTAMAQACGIRSPLRNLPSLALGASEVTLLELTSSYGTFATLGSWTDPKIIRRVEDRNGIVLDRFDQFPTNVLDSSTAQKVDYVLRSAVVGGTAKLAASIPNARGKTGTTQDDKDAVFIGYTPELVTGVWLGNDRPSRMRAIWGGTGCAPIWKSYMSRSLKGYPRRTLLPTWTPSKPTAAQPAAPPAGELESLQAAASDTGQTSSMEGEQIQHSTGNGETRAWEGETIQEVPVESASFGGELDNSSRAKQVRLCPESGEKAGSSCLNTFTTQLEPGVVLSTCTLHRATDDRSKRIWNTSGESQVYEQEVWGGSSSRG